MFEAITAAPPDAILGLTEAFKLDANPRKVNLGAGVFVDETGRTPILASVKAAEAAILAAAQTKSYMPIAGDPTYRRLVQELVFGAEHPALRDQRARTAHTPGGTAALRVGADFLRKFFPQASVWLSKPTWTNHRGVFTAAGFTVKEYPYYNPATKELDHAAFLAALRQIPAGDVVLLHACCHNPTGVDLTPAQWAEVAAIAAARRWLPFVDFAYQGYGDGLEPDRASVLALAAQCPELLIASSFSKNFGLYQDRTGALTLLAADAHAAGATFSNIESVIRVNYSNPPAHGSLIVSHILTTPELKRQWLGELDAMRHHISGVRHKFVAGLQAHGAPGNFDFIARQKGMFSFSGLSDAQVAWLRVERSIYIVAGGRINVAGITPANFDYLCAALAAALRA
ncbi:MAG: aspartate/tyrosine/aromatic aminotransferase [Verrucomicrobia bacterium]|nr:MAG: aspartate/tyrosine/aromatic aminotransferase [Verrucomicrobiota bacterium]